MSSLSPSELFCTFQRRNFEAYHTRTSKYNAHRKSIFYMAYLQELELVCQSVFFVFCYLLFPSRRRTMQLHRHFKKAYRSAIFCNTNVSDLLVIVMQTSLALENYLNRTMALETFLSPGEHNLKTKS